MGVASSTRGRRKDVSRDRCKHCRLGLPEINFRHRVALFDGFAGVAAMNKSTSWDLRSKCLFGIVPLYRLSLRNTGRERTSLGVAASSSMVRGYCNIVPGVDGHLFLFLGFAGTLLPGSLDIILWVWIAARDIRATGSYPLTGEMYLPRSTYIAPRVPFAWEGGRNVVRLLL